MKGAGGIFSRGTPVSYLIMPFISYFISFIRLVSFIRAGIHSTYVEAYNISVFHPRTIIINARRWGGAGRVGQ